MRTSEPLRQMQVRLCDALARFSTTLAQVSDDPLSDLEGANLLCRYLHAILAFCVWVVIGLSLRAIGSPYLPFDSARAEDHIPGTIDRTTCTQIIRGSTWNIRKDPSVSPSMFSASWRIHMGG